MHSAPTPPPEAPSPRFVTKSKLAGLLGVSTRTVTAYISARYLPTPHRLGRDAAWPVEALRDSLSMSADVHLPANIRSRLQDCLALIDRDDIGVSATDARKARLAAGHLVDDDANFDLDWRPQIHTRNALLRESARGHENEAQNYDWRSSERKDLQQWAGDLRAKVDRNEAILEGNFLPAHSENQVLGSTDLWTNSMFTVRNSREPREPYRRISFTRPGSDMTFTYEGPELRQDDNLLFSVLVRVAADARPGRLVGFSAGTLCTELYGSDSGPLRALLRAGIGRLQSGKVTFPDFTVQLVGRFEHPSRGLWAVSLDPDVLRLFSDGRQVWLKLDAALFYGKGLTAWLYRYIRSQTTLWPTKVTRLHALSGSSATPKSYREMLRDSLKALAAGGEIDEGWRFDEAGMVRWRKPLKAELQLLAHDS